MYIEGQHIAANPETDPKTLERLSKSKIKFIVEAVAGNPNTPIQVLWEIIKYFPYQVVNNPVFELIILEDPNWITGISRKDLIEIMEKPSIPTILSEEALKHKDSSIRASVIEATLKNPQTPTRQLEEMTLYYGTLLHEVLEHPNITFDSLKKFATCNKTSIQTRMAEYYLIYYYRPTSTLSLCQDDILEIMETMIQNAIEHENLRVMKMLLQHPKTHKKHVKILLRNLPYRTHLKLAGDGTIPAQVLDEMISMIDYSDPLQIQICQLIAANPGTSMDILEKFADSEHKSILLNLATRTIFSQALLVKLIINPYKKTTKKLRRNNEIRSKLLAELKEHPNQMVREFVAQHPNTPTT
jgi:hypothetical protein